jgi:2'-5' RNA ligase
MAHGIYIVADLFGAEAERIAELQRRLDPKLAALGRPHVTFAGSSGVGVLPTGLTHEQLSAALAPVAASTPPLEFVFGLPERFPQTNIIHLPLPVHGPVRWLYDRIAMCGLPFVPAKFAFTPHCTVHFYRTMAQATWDVARKFRVRAPIRVDRIQCYDTRDPQPAVLVGEFALTGGAA